MSKKVALNEIGFITAYGWEATVVTNQHKYQVDISKAYNFRRDADFVYVFLTSKRKPIANLPNIIIFSSYFFYRKLFKRKRGI